ncbi:hypothetical protein [Algoriphagus boritolerans]|uniref:hypothetical protein n=1 Tax=Algoriphagus boritolerans TaxID=308111 RepID=UPI000A9FB1DB
MWRARWADVAAGQRSASCGWSFATSRLFGYFLAHKKYQRKKTPRASEISHKVSMPEIEQDEDRHTLMIINHARFSRRKIGTGYLTNKYQIINR